MKRIIMHWTAGNRSASDVDREHYHVLVESSGRIVMGKMKPEANASTTDGQYAAHTRGLNTGSIGVAMCGMWDAQERPFVAGPHPLTATQYKAFLDAVADLCETYKIAVTPQTVLTHAEVQTTLGVAQRSKWDITWLPGMAGPGQPIAVGDRIRSDVRAAINPSPRKAPIVVSAPKVELANRSISRVSPLSSQSFWSRLAAFLRKGA